MIRNIHQWLTVAHASTESRLPVATITAMIEAGQLPSKTVNGSVQLVYSRDLASALSRRVVLAKQVAEKE